MKTKILLATMLTGISVVILACSDPEGCEEDPQLCLASCITNPQACIDEDVTLSEVPSDTIQIVSKLPVRE